MIHEGNEEDGERVFLSRRPAFQLSHWRDVRVRKVPLEIVSDRRANPTMQRLGINGHLRGRGHVRSGSVQAGIPRDM